MKADIKYSTPEEALSIIKSGDRVFMHGSAQTPVFIINELAKQAHRLRDVEIVSISVYGDLEIAKRGEKVVVSFAYDREIHLVGPAYLVLKYQASTQ